MIASKGPVRTPSKVSTHSLGKFQKERKRHTVYLKQQWLKSPNLMMDIIYTVKKFYQLLSKIKSKRSTPSHIIIKWTKAKDTKIILKAEKNELLTTYKGYSIRLSVNLLSETLETRKVNIFKEWKKKLSTSNSSLAKLSQKGEINAFPDNSWTCSLQLDLPCKKY